MKTPFDDLEGPVKWWAVITTIVAAGTVALLVWYVLIPALRGEPLAPCPPTMQGCDSPSYSPRGT